MLKKLKEEVFGHPLIYLPLLFILLAAFYIRVYRLNDLLGFYYDQGRDALIVWDLLQKGDIPFIGPTTGIAGIFRGPFYYWLLAPFYFLGRGSPVWPSVFLSFTTVLAIIVVYFLGYKLRGRLTGLIAAIISAFSFNIVMASRWLSNPTPMLLISVLLVLMMVLVTEKKKYAWVGIFFLFGLSLFHFGSSGEAFYLPALIIFAIWQRKNLPTKKIFILSLLSFVLTILPLVAFDIKNNGLLVSNIKNFLIGGESFGLPTWRNIGDRALFLYDVFTNKIFLGRWEKEIFLLSVVGVGFIYYLHKLEKNKSVKILLLLLGVGSIGIILFQGNFGNIYDYYLTGYYLPFVLLFSVTLGALWENKVGKLFVIYFIFFFLKSASDPLTYKLSDQVDGPNSIAFKNQKQAIDWIYQTADGKEFNVDVYVPPVIPYSYDYLLKWYPNTAGFSGKNGRLEDKRVPLLYTLYEQDPPYPDRLQAWLDRQMGIAEVKDSARFGGITVESRMRIER